jgi:transposase-like protein
MPAKKPSVAMNMMRLMEEFDTDSECRAVLENLRWPDGIRCPRCDGDKVYRAEPRKQFDCAGCGYQFSVMSGTIFHDSHLPLPKWFVAIYLMTESKKGISANQMKRTLGVSYKTAWYLCHRIRAAMKDAAAPLLSGIIEVDETYIGGKVRGKGHGYRGNKTMVVGAVARGGQVGVKVEKRNDRQTLHGFIRSVAADDTEAIHTDEWPAYLGIADANTRHETVNHSQEEWVRADVHTNTVESVWSLLKRSIVGSYHQLSAKHMEAYLDEMAFRFNNRHNQYLFRDTLMKLVGAANLPYSELTA